MYEDFDTGELKKSEEDEDSEAWSYSYPSYTRFTFTGKAKSRLGRNHHKSSRQMVNKHEIKFKEDINYTDVSSSSHFKQPLNTEASRTPGWLRGEPLHTTNPFTSGTNIFRHTKSVFDNERDTNGSGVDASSQSNFLFTLQKNSAQNFNCNTNLALNETTFKSEENHSNTLKELNHLLKKSFPKASYSTKPKEENKENMIDRNVENKRSKESVSFDPSWNQLKRICDNAIPYATAKTDAGTNRYSERMSHESLRPSKFAFPSIFDSSNEKKKHDNEDSSNTPLDLSSGESFSNKAFSHGSITRRAVDLSTANTNECQNQVPEQVKGITKRNTYKDDDSSKSNSSDAAISSILPTFLNPANKTKLKEPCQEFNMFSDGFHLVDTKNVTCVSNDSSLTPDIVKDSFVIQPIKSNLNSHYSAKISQDNSESKENLAESSVVGSEVQYSSSNYNPVLENSVLKEDLPPDYLLKVLPISAFKHPVISPPLSTKCSPEFPVCIMNDNQMSPKDVKEVNNLQNIELRTSDTNNSLLNKHEENVLSNTSMQITNPKQPTTLQSCLPTIAEDEQTPFTLSNKLNQKHLPFVYSSQSSMVADTSKLKCVTENEHSLSKNSSSEELKNPLSCINQIETSKNVFSSLSSSSDNCVSGQANQPKFHESQDIFHQPQPHHEFLLNSDILKPKNILKEVPPSHSYQRTQDYYLPLEKNIVPSQNSSKQEVFQQETNSYQRRFENKSSAICKQQSDNVSQPSDIDKQKTYLAPHSQHPLDLKNSNDFPHVKPEIPLPVINRQNLPLMDKSLNNFKMSATRGLLSQANAEIYVNRKAYTVLSLLGRGGSSEVYQVLDPRSSKLLAVKCVDLSNVDRTIADGYLNEIEVLSKLQGCSCVIRMFDHEYVEEYKMLYVVMEKGDTDLSKLIRDISKTKKISMSMIIYYWTEMLTAVRDIHEQGIIHSDLKPANFLLVSGRLKLIDFGIASSQGDMTSVVKENTTGTWNYMSPEAIRNTSVCGKGFKITYKSDVWSLGCILYNLLYGKTPFSHITNTWAKLQAIADPNQCVEFPEIGAPVVLSEALRSCFHRDPKQRPTVAELLSLPYHAQRDSTHIGHQLLSILPNEWWLKVAHLFPEVKCHQDDKNPNRGNTS